jgi:hypothetical protein
MITGQDRPAPFFCPRCGGPMYKPAGSSFYWHATNNHPRCTITNIADVSTIVPISDEALDAEPQRWPWKKKNE